MRASHHPSPRYGSFRSATARFHSFSTTLQLISGIPDSDLPIPSAETLIKAYCAKVGRAYPIPKWQAAVSFAFFRVIATLSCFRYKLTHLDLQGAVIYQGIAARAAMGVASSANAAAYADAFKPLALLALEAKDLGSGQTKL